MVRADVAGHGLSARNDGAPRWTLRRDGSGGSHGRTSSDPRPARSVADRYQHQVGRGGSERGRATARPRFTVLASQAKPARPFGGPILRDPCPPGYPQHDGPPPVAPSDVQRPVHPSTGTRADPAGLCRNVSCLWASAPLSARSRPQCLGRPQPPRPDGCSGRPQRPAPSRSGRAVSTPDGRSVRGGHRSSGRGVRMVADARW